ncbi:3-deoxy-manno-octulosonate cytidylyltransferase [Coxiella endosymbiont of Amblyomma americanum]|uniref:3-deoxy-manno-octulosonate cytidylyltransferase n=1 Tax=Coxiella endosymbiont of Amblyomma americanum TaxID=325775 RepID=UPI00057F9305|nr:3-deoxy-manno-octulosonate cytidylyltransferase [Coxiella endosymbiont of Amblyomma americanum]AJC50337.1 3-deoxy-manno-octulosonate cytidylyltransferase [Coxiella endosymbiont of Amblyomma americanum]AUJ58682.1 3-deoxy-manno-octulosonate cytidylyltransferase [Coxiella-like endosymbiont of Amblyomma americanum]
MEFRVIIPARYNSDRLPGKVLADISGKPMIQHVHDSALKSGAKSVIIATDDNRISKVAKNFGAVVYMTAANHRSGTERVTEVAVSLGLKDDAIVVCLQGDEPLITPKSIRALVEDLNQHNEEKVASLCTAIVDIKELLNPNVTKVVLDHNNFALYFSRAPIPGSKRSLPNKKEDGVKLNGSYFRHVGVYAYRLRFLKKYFLWKKEGCFIEKIEDLEQLRLLWHGVHIHMVIIKKAAHLVNVDTREDLQRVRKIFTQK